MKSQKIKDIKESSTKNFIEMAKCLYVMGMQIYEGQGDYELLASIILDKNSTDSYLSHIIWLSVLMDIWKRLVK